MRALSEGHRPGLGMVDVDLAARLAARLAAPAPLDRSYLLDDLKETFAGLVAQAEPLVAEETGLAPGTPAMARVLSRREWATANIESILTLLGPLLERLNERIPDRPGSRLLRVAYGPTLGAQLGAVLAFLSRHVLGQYDLLVGHADQVWFVGPNIVLTERRFGFAPRDFRLWVVLHELTHRAQFEGTPWLREHLLEALRELMTSLELDPRVLIERAFEIGRQRGEAPLGMRMLGPEQRALFDRLQAFMTVIEGHGNFVMDRIGEARIPSQDRMRRTLRDVSGSGGLLTRMLSRLFGLELKRRQYEEGQRFFNAIQASADRAAVAACFSSPDALPTLEEVRSPESWLERVRP